MTRGPQLRRLPSSWVLTLRLRWVRYWTSFCLRRTNRRLRKEQQRERLLLMSLDSNRLRLKELEQAQQMHLHRLQEMAASTQFRLTGLLPVQAPDPESRELDRVLGLSMPPH